MGKYIFLVLLVILFVCLEIGFFSGLTIFGGTINLIVLILVASFFLEVKREGLIIVLSIALIYDFYLYSFFGLAIFAVLGIYFSLSFFESRFSPNSSYLMILMLVFFSSIFFDLIVLGGLAVYAHLNFFYIILYTILPDALLNLLVVFPFYILSRKFISLLRLYRIIGKKERKVAVGF